MIQPASADRANWRTPPHSRWAFQHVRELMAVADIGHDPATVRDLPESPRSLDAVRVDAGGGRILSFDETLEATASDGLLVLHDGAVVFERYWNGMTAGTPHILMSATKSVTGLIAALLADQGVLDLEAPVSAYVPEVANSPYEDATLRLLVDMRAGVRLDPAQLTSYTAATGWEAPGPTPADLHEFFATLSGPSPEHGGAFAYVSSNTDLLGWAIERASGRRFADIASDLLWKPMGAADGAFITTDDAGAPRCTGGLNATVRDFARLGLLVSEDGWREGREVIPTALIDDIATGGDHDAWARGEFAPAFRGMTMRYRSGWYIIDDAPQTLFAMGIHGQNLFVDRTNRIVMAKVSSWPGPFEPRTAMLTHRLFDAVREALLAG